jgi:hypothetical protein
VGEAGWAVPTREIPAPAVAAESRAAARSRPPLRSAEGNWVKGHTDTGGGSANAGHSMQCRQLTCGGMAHSRRKLNGSHAALSVGLEWPRANCLQYCQRASRHLYYMIRGVYQGVEQQPRLGFQNNLLTDCRVEEYSVAGACCQCRPQSSTGIWANVLVLVLQEHNHP